MIRSFVHSKKLERKVILANVFLIISSLSSVFSECPPPKKLINFSEWDPKESKDTGGYFTPLAMQNDTNLIKEMLKGSSLNPDQDLKKICIRVKYKGEFEEVSVSGYNSTSNYKCDKIGSGNEWSFECQHQNGKEDFSYKLYGTLTDKKTFVFIIRCWKSGLRGWTVFSTRKELHEDSHFHILEHAKSQGFETADAYPLSYKFCKTIVILMNDPGWLTSGSGSILIAKQNPTFISYDFHIKRVIRGKQKKFCFTDFVELEALDSNL